MFCQICGDSRFLVYKGSKPYLGQLLIDYQVLFQSLNNGLVTEVFISGFTDAIRLFHELTHQATLIGIT